MILGRMLPNRNAVKVWYTRVSHLFWPGSVASTTDEEIDGKRSGMSNRSVGSRKTVQAAAGGQTTG